MKSPTRAAALLLAAAASLLLLLVRSSDAALSCSTVIQDVLPCASYLRSGGGTPSDACCNGARALASAASSTADRQAACSCLKSASQSLSPNPAVAQSLPGKCGISLGYTISPSIDCTKIT